MTNLRFYVHTTDSANEPFASYLVIDAPMLPSVGDSFVIRDDYNRPVMELPIMDAPQLRVVSTQWRHDMTSMDVWVDTTASDQALLTILPPNHDWIVYRGK